MLVIHVVPAISEEASGPSYSVSRLCESLIGTGVDARLATLDWAPVARKAEYVTTFQLGFGPRRLGRSPQMRRWLNHEASSGRIAVLHSHGLWMMPNVYPLHACRHGRCQLIVSPRGTLSRWALKRNAVRKNVFWRLLQARVLQAARCLHATAENEYEDIRRLGFQQPVCILPNGIDLPVLRPKDQRARRQLLFLGRIHPKKGIDVLLKAWHMVAHRFQDWELRIAGPDNEGHLTEMRMLAARLHLERVLFCGPLFGEEKFHAYQDASLFVLPTYSENFGMTVAEALASGTPAIVSQGAPWGGLVEHGAGWWIGIGVDPLADCLLAALSTPADVLREMGLAGRDWMRSEFTWERIGEQFEATYRWLLGTGSSPACVKLD